MNSNQGIRMLVVRNASAAILMASFAGGCTPESAVEAHANTMGEERERAAAVAAAPTPRPTPIEAEVAAAVAAPTAEDQSMAPADVEITRQIREAVTLNAALSVEARACTIVTRSAVVTLRGSVENDAERQTIEGFARRTAGVTRVEDMLVVSN